MTRIERQERSGLERGPATRGEKSPEGQNPMSVTGMK